MELTTRTEKAMQDVEDKDGLMGWDNQEDMMAALEDIHMLPSYYWVGGNKYDIEQTEKGFTTTYHSAKQGGVLLATLTVVENSDNEEDIVSIRGEWLVKGQKLMHTDLYTCLSWLGRRVEEAIDDVQAEIRMMGVSDE